MIRMFGDWLVVNQVLRLNPAAALLGTIDRGSLAGIQRSWAAFGLVFPSPSLHYSRRSRISHRRGLLDRERSLSDAATDAAGGVEWPFTAPGGCGGQVGGRFCRNGRCRPGPRRAPSPRAGSD